MKYHSLMRMDWAASKENTWWTAKDIADVMCENISTIRNILQQLIKEGMVFKDSRSYYTSARTRRI